MMLSAIAAAVVLAAVPGHAQSVSTTSFDHFPTGFPLTGTHVSVPCASCHINARYKTTPRACFGCHNGMTAPGAASVLSHPVTTNYCEGCHQTTTWRDYRFIDHVQALGPCANCHNNKIAAGKLAQALMHGARVVALRGNFDEALSLVRELTQRHPIALVNSVNPLRIEGQKTAAFEVAEALGRAPDVLALPVGNAGNITAYWRGFTELGGQRPVLLGFQAAGAAPLVSGSPVARPETVATAIRIGNPASWQTAAAAQRESGGLFAAVTDAEILAASRRLSREAGVFCEPASAAPVAGLLRLAREKTDFSGRIVVAVLTGHGLKDPQSAIDAQAGTGPVVDDDPAALEAALA